MIGPKKLSTIRQQLRHASSANGNDPVRLLEERIAAAKSAETGADRNAEVLDSLCRVLLDPPRKDE